MAINGKVLERLWQHNKEEEVPVCLDLYDSHWEIAAFLTFGLICLKNIKSNLIILCFSIK